MEQSVDDKKCVVYVIRSKSERIKNLPIEYHIDHSRQQASLFPVMQSKITFAGRCSVFLRLK